MLSPWNFYDKRKIIFYKDLSLEFYDLEKNEIKGSIIITPDFLAIQRDKFHFDLTSLRITYSFLSKDEKEVKCWVDVINNNRNAKHGGHHTTMNLYKI